MPLHESIETDRLLLRRWQDDDLPLFAAMNSDPRVMEFFPKLLTAEESNAIVTRIRDHFDQHQFGLWAVEVIGEANFIGFIGLSRTRFEAHFTPCVEIGWRLAAPHWGNGYATEGAGAALKFAFEELGLQEVVAMTSVDNQRSRRVMEKLDMTRNPDDDFDHPLVEDPKLVRHVLYRVKNPIQ